MASLFYVLDLRGDFFPRHNTLVDRRVSICKHIGFESRLHLSGPLFWAFWSPFEFSRQEN